MNPDNNGFEADPQVKFNAAYPYGANGSVYFFDNRPGAGQDQDFDSAKKLLYTVRSSYLRYGPEDLIGPYLLDEYDQKSFIFLVFTRTPCNCNIKEDHTAGEWFSVRFVPCAGMPAGCEDLDLCTTDEGSLADTLQKRLCEGSGAFLEKFTSITRICSTDRVCELSKTRQPKVGATALAFWLTNYLFLRTVSPGVKYLIGLFHNDLIAKSLCNLPGLGSALLEFTPAYLTLGFSNSGSVRLSRNGTAFKFPRYYFNNEQLLKLCDDLAAHGKLDKLIAEEARSTKLQFFGKYLYSEGLLSNSQITGVELRELVNKYVDDAPEMKIMEVARWEDCIEKVVGNLGVEFVTRLTR